MKVIIKIETSVDIDEENEDMALQIAADMYRHNEIPLQIELLDEIQFSVSAGW